MVLLQIDAYMHKLNMIFMFIYILELNTMSA